MGDYLADPRWYRLELAAAGTLLEDLIRLRPATEIPLPHPADGVGQFPLHQCPNPPRGRTAGLIQPIPVATASPAQPFLDHPGIEQLTVPI